MKKKKWSKKEKLAILREASEKGVEVTIRLHGTYPSTFYSWRRKMQMEGEAGFVSLITKSVPPICTKSVPLYFVNFSGSKPEATCTEWTFTSPLKPY